MPTFNSICQDATSQFENGVSDLIDEKIKSNTEKQKFTLIGLYNTKIKGFIKKNAKQDLNAVIDNPKERAVDYLDVGHYIRFFKNINDQNFVCDNFAHFVPNAHKKDRTIFFDYLERISEYRNALTHRGKKPFTKVDSIFFIGFLRKAAHILELQDVVEQMRIREQEIEGDVTVAVLKKDNLPEPDYDDTGLIGREKLLPDVVRWIKRNRITALAGVGGIGKTALVIAACKEILQEEKNDFDFIHYYSAKRNKLTDLDIEPITNAIKDADTLFTKFSDDIQQAGQIVNSEVNSLINYLINRKVILVIDNLETILNDSKIIKFIQEFEDKAEESRLVITTRIGLQVKITQKEEPVPALLRDDAKKLYKGLVKIVGEKTIFGETKISDEDIDKDLKLLNDNPLVIRNYISALKRKSRLEVLKELEQGKAPLDFLMADVFEHLSKVGKELIYSLVYAERSLLPLEIEFINDVLEDQKKQKRLSKARNDLSIAGWIAKGERLGEEDTFYASDVTRNFIKKLPNKDEKTLQYSAKIKELDRMKTTYNNREKYEDGTDDFFSFDMSSDSSYLVFGLLYESVKLWMSGNTPTALRSVQKAEKINPEEAEVFRVMALIQSRQQSGREDTIANYKQAIARKPERLDYKIWYASYLMNNYASPNELNNTSIDTDERKPLNVDKSDLIVAEQVINECMEIEKIRGNENRSPKLKRLSIDVKFRQNLKEKIEEAEKELDDLIGYITEVHKQDSNKIEEDEIRKTHDLSVKSYTNYINYLVNDRNKKSLHEATDKLAKHVENYKKIIVTFGTTKCMDSRIENQYRYLKYAIQDLHSNQVKEERIRIEELANFLPIGNLIEFEYLESNVLGQIVNVLSYACWVRPNDEYLVEKYLPNSIGVKSGIFCKFSNIRSLLSEEDHKKLGTIPIETEVEFNIYQGNRGYEAVITKMH